MSHSNQEVFFGTAPLVTSPQERIPYILGQHPGVFLNTTNWVTVELIDYTVTAYSSWGDGVDSTSLGYAKDTNFEDDLVSWGAVSLSHTEQHGFLAGFPQLQITSEERAINCLHLIYNNTDVIGTSYAIPLSSIRNLYVFSDQRTKLQLEIDELSEGSDSRYEIPLAKDRKTGEVVYKKASVDDIQYVIDQLDELPAAVLPTSHPSVVRSRYARDTELKTILKPQ